ncbi:winged helix-turn-helix domain-containing protein, partial [Burkholderia sp. JPY481]
MDWKVSGSQDDIEFGPFKLFVLERRLERRGVPVKVGSRALEILTVLTQNAGQIVDKRVLLDRVWPGMIVEENTLRVHIRDLRKTLEDGVGDNRYIVNVPGRGYGFLVREADSPAVTEAPLSHATVSERLPPRPQAVVGRDDAVATAAALLLGKRFVTLHGPGGVGKTTIATVVAHDLDRHFDGATFFIDLGTITDAEFVPVVLASTLGLLLPSEDAATTLIRSLRNRRLLLILDSCEHVIDAVADLAERMFRWAPDVSLLATSREPLRVEGEHIVSVGPLELPTDAGELSTDEILASPAASFFVQRAQASGPWFEPSASNARLIVQICRKLDGIALAIELAAMRAGMHGLHETAELLHSSLQLEWKGRRTASRRHQTLNAMLDWSHDLISEAERRVLRRLSIFVGRFTLEDAQVLAADDQIPGLRVVDLLDQLVAKSLVSFHASEQGTRYRLLDTTRAYARTKLVESGEESSTSCRHAAHCLVFLRRTCAGPSAGPALARHRNARAAWLGNVRAALQWCFGPDGDRQLGVELAAAASSLFIDLSLVSECRRWAEQALRWLDMLDRGNRLELDLQAALGHALMFTIGNDDQVQTALDRGLQIARDISDPFAEFRLLGQLHIFCSRTGQFERLLPICDRLWELAALLQDPVPVAAAHVMSGVSFHLLGDQQRARSHLEDPVHQTDVVRQVGPGHFALHHNPQIIIMRALWLQGHPDRAVHTARTLVAQLAPERDAVKFAIALIWATYVHKWLGDWAAVEANASRLIDHAERYGLQPYLTVGAALRGKILIARGDLDGGIDLLRDAVRKLRADRYEFYTPELCCALALALAARGRPDQAAPIIDETFERVQRHGGAYSMPELLRVRGEVHAAAADESGAARLFEQAIT